MQRASPLTGWIVPLNKYVLILFSLTGTYWSQFHEHWFLVSPSLSLVSSSLFLSPSVSHLGGKGKNETPGITAKFGIEAGDQSFGYFQHLRDTVPFQCEVDEGISLVFHAES